MVSAGGQAAISTATDANLLSQRHAAWAVKDGISLFTRGEAKDSKHPVQDTGMKLHAASGNVNTQAQSGGITVTAAKAIDIQSTTANITISAPAASCSTAAVGTSRSMAGILRLGLRGREFQGFYEGVGWGGSASHDGFSAPKAKPHLRRTIRLDG